MFENVILLSFAIILHCILPTLPEPVNARINSNCYGIIVGEQRWNGTVFINTVYAFSMDFITSNFVILGTILTTKPTEIGSFDYDHDYGSMFYVTNYSGTQSLLESRIVNGGLPNSLWDLDTDILGMSYDSVSKRVYYVTKDELGSFAYNGTGKTVIKMQPNGFSNVKEILFDSTLNKVYFLTAIGQIKSLILNTKKIQVEFFTNGEDAKLFSCLILHADREKSSVVEVCYRHQLAKIVSCKGRDGTRKLTISFPIASISRTSEFYYGLAIRDAGYVPFKTRNGETIQVLNRTISSPASSCIKYIQKDPADRCTDQENKCSDSIEGVHLDAMCSRRSLSLCSYSCKKGYASRKLLECFKGEWRTNASTLCGLRNIGRTTTTLIIVVVVTAFCCICILVIYLYARSVRKKRQAIEADAEQTGNDEHLALPSVPFSKTSTTEEKQRTNPADDFDLCEPPSTSSSSPLLAISEERSFDLHACIGEEEAIELKAEMVEEVGELPAQRQWKVDETGALKKRRRRHASDVCHSAVEREKDDEFNDAINRCDLVKLRQIMATSYRGDFRNRARNKKLLKLANKFNKRVFGVLRKLKQPPGVTHDVLVASLMLIGVSEQRSRNWAECITRPVSQTPHFMKRLLVVKTNTIKVNTAKRSLQAIEPYTFENVEVACPGLGALYRLILEICDEKMKNKVVKIEKSKSLETIYAWSATFDDKSSDEEVTFQETS